MVLTYEPRLEKTLHQQESKKMNSDVNFLYRKAKNYAKELNKTNVTLVNLYAKRLDKYDTTKKVITKINLEIRVS